MKPIIINTQQCRTLLEEVCSHCNSLPIIISPEKQSITLFDNDDNKQLRIRLPLLLNIPMINNPSDDVLRSSQALTIDTMKEILRTPQELSCYWVILFQAGAAALGVVVDGKLTNHKMIKKYMVRKKQGKAQLSYLKTKGKSRYGSRLRLRNSQLFFAEIAEKLASWHEELEPQKIFSNLPVSLMPHLLAEDELPFMKDDQRLQKIPRHINKPSYLELKRVINSFQYGEVTILDSDNNISITVRELLRSWR